MAWSNAAQFARPAPPDSHRAEFNEYKFEATSSAPPRKPAGAHGVRGTRGRVLLKGGAVFAPSQDATGGSALDRFRPPPGQSSAGLRGEPHAVLSSAEGAPGTDTGSPALIGYAVPETRVTASNHRPAGSGDSGPASACRAVGLPPGGRGICRRQGRGPSPLFPAEALALVVMHSPRLTHSFFGTSRLQLPVSARAEARRWRAGGAPLKS